MHLPSLTFLQNGAMRVLLDVSLSIYLNSRVPQGQLCSKEYNASFVVRNTMPAL